MTDRVNLIETIAEEPRFSTFSRYIGSSKANAIFSRPGHFTVFVPTNEAFAKIPDDQMNAMLNEPGQHELKALLEYHIVPGRIMAANVGAQQVRNSVTGEEIDFADYQGIKVNGTPLQDRNIEATDGVIHSLGTVLAPKPLAGSKPIPSTATPVANRLRPVVPAAVGIKPLASAASVTPILAGMNPAITQEFPLAEPEALPLAAKAADTAKPIF
ncbi:MAG: fasciclin domain-containing protein [Pyrinomonadaceae bacterium]